MGATAVPHFESHLVSRLSTQEGPPSAPRESSNSEHARQASVCGPTTSKSSESIIPSPTRINSLPERRPEHERKIEGRRSLPTHRAHRNGSDDIRRYPGSDESRRSSVGSPCA